MTFAVDRHGLHVVTTDTSVDVEGDPSWCGEPVPRRERPPLAELAANRLRALGCWFMFAARRLALRKNPFVSQTYALPVVGHRGPWSVKVPLAFRGASHTGVRCVGSGGLPHLQPLRPLVRYAPAPTPDGATRVRVSRRGWRAQPRHEPELYGPQADGWVTRG